jgi:filamentous hemagglutinin family protein
MSVTSHTSSLSVSPQKKSGRFKAWLMLSGSVVTLVAASSVAMANPQGGVVVGGSANFVQTPTEFQIHQQSDRALIEWQSFDIDAGETTRFLQPSASSIALNRVVNSDQITRINGNLFANGRVIVINPNGVLIGATGNVDANSFVATTADISNQEFLTAPKILTFDRAGQDHGLVENNGRITVSETGLAALVAPTARNNGIIEARLSQVQLAGADTFALDFYGDGLVNFSLGSKNSPNKRVLTAENNGQIFADGGTVALTAADASNVVDTVVNNTGTIRAQGLVSRNGEIILTGKGAKVKVSGTLDASGKKSIGKKDGGSIKIGGDKMGQGSLAKAQDVTIDPQALILANAGDQGQGGQVIVWADRNLYSRGRFFAQGGDFGGNGGFVETSSPNFLNVDGTIVNTLSPFGKAGDWLIDPTNITIVNSGGVNYVPAHGTNSSGDVSILASSINNATSNVILYASNDIFFNADIAMVNFGVGLTARAGDDIRILNQSISTNRGNILLEAGLVSYVGNLDIQNSVLDTNGGSLSLLSGNDVFIRNSNFRTDGGIVLVQTDDDIDINNGRFSTVGGQASFIADDNIELQRLIVNTTGGSSPGSITVRDDSDSNISTSELGNNNTYSSGDNGGIIRIQAQNVESNANNNCLKAGGSSNSCVSYVADPINITITANALSKTYGQNDPLLTYILSSNLASGNNVSGSLLRNPGQNVGTYAINLGSLNILGPTAYNITYVPKNFTINPAILSVLAAAKTKTYGQVDPALTYTFSGLVNGDTSSVFTGGLVRASGENVGTYAISQGSLSAGNNYTINYTGNNLVINKALLKAIVQDASRAYGDPNSSFLINYEGFKFLDGVSDIDTLATAISSATATSNAGTTHSIIASGASDNNYDFQYVNGTLTIGKRNITAQVKPYQRQYGDPNPVWDWTYVTWGNLANGETGAVIDALTFETFSNINMNAGSWNDLILKTFSDNNYNLVSNQKSSVEVIKRNITAQVKPYQRQYGDPNPVWDWTYVTWGNLANGETGAVIDALTFETFSNINMNAGSWNDLILKTFSDNNYNLVSNQKSSVEVIKRNITAKVNNDRRRYGDANPIWNWQDVTWYNLANGQDGSVIDTLLIQAPTATLTSNAGTNHNISIVNFSDNNYNLVSSTAGNLRINKARLIAKADDKTRAYGDANPALTISYSGWKNGDDVTDLNVVPTASTTANELSDVGSYTIKVNGGSDNNYRIVRRNGTLKVKKADLTVRTFDATKVYGQNDPLPWQLEVTGWKNGQSTNDVNVNTWRDIGEDVGLYTIYADLNDKPLSSILKNYKVTYDYGDLDITPAKLSIRADNKSKFFGQADPALTFTATGFQFSDDLSLLKGSLIREKGEDIGEYDIFGKFGIKSNNYKIEFTKGLFTIINPPVGNFSNAPVGALGRPIISVADRTLNQNTSFLPFNTNGINVDVGLLAGISPNAGGTNAANLNNLTPNAGDEDGSNVANIEPAAGGDESSSVQQDDTAGNSDIACANSFLDNKPCQNESAN